MRLIVIFSFLLSIAQASPVNFNIPAQPAGHALMAFAYQTGIEVLFSFDDLNKTISTALSGQHEPEDAIRYLLRDTGFYAHRTASGRFIVNLVICRLPACSEGDNLGVASSSTALLLTPG